jgi:hypothetical protein
MTTTKPSCGPKVVILKPASTRGVSHCGLAIYIKKYLKAKEEEELWKLKYFTHAKIYINLQKILLKETQILQDIL